MFSQQILHDPHQRPLRPRDPPDDLFGQSSIASGLGLHRDIIVFPSASVIIDDHSPVVGWPAVHRYEKCQK